MKKIIMYEGGQEHIFEAKKLRTPLQEGGTCDWVPEEEVQTTTKQITKNGTYKAKDDDKYAYSEVTVNVSGGNGSADSHGKPTGGDIKPGGAGSAVVGTDPETGNDVVVGVDEDGNLVNTPLPSSIVLVTNPTKMDYNDGESIDLSGAVVVAKMADGTTWTDADHPNGHVSCTPEPTAADESQASGDSTATSDAQGNLSQPIAFLPAGSEVHLIVNQFTDNLKLRFDCDTIFIEHANGYRYYGADANSNNLCVYRKEWRTSWGQTEPTEWGYQNPIANSVSSYTKDGKKVYYAGRSSTAGVQEWIEAPPFAGTNVSPNGSDMWTIVYGHRTSGGTQEIALKWARPGDDKVLSTTMEITVTSMGGSHTSESSSGTEGSGGGGTF